LTTAVNTGAATTGEPFPNTNAALFANEGETMAQTLARISCEKGSALAPCSETLTTDVVYANVWTQGVTLPVGETDASFSYTYGGTQGIPSAPPMSTSLERAVPDHHPLCESEFEPDAALHSELVELDHAHRDRERRCQYAHHLHALPQHGEREECDPGAGRAARLDGRRVERCDDGRHIL
jgi:hypothetical protein